MRVEINYPAASSGVLIELLIIVNLNETLQKDFENHIVPAVIWSAARYLIFAQPEIPHIRSE